jgi:dihydrofolate reductase
MGVVFVDVGVSLDGYMAGSNRGPDNPMGGVAMSIHEWIFATASFREHLGMEGGASGTPDDDMIKHVFARSGANVMGRRMFDEGEVAWPEKAPFGCPVYVLTHHPREPWVRKGGTTFYFVTDGIESALAHAKAAAKGKDVRISGGAETIREYLDAGLVEELTLHIAPAMLGDGLRLLAGPGSGRWKFEQVASSGSELVTHITYRVVGK